MEGKKNIIIREREKKANEKERKIKKGGRSYAMPMR